MSDLTVGILRQLSFSKFPYSFLNDFLRNGQFERILMVLTSSVAELDACAICCLWPNQWELKVCLGNGILDFQAVGWLQAT